MGSLFEAIIHDDELNETGDFPKVLSEGIYCPQEVHRAVWNWFSKRKPVWMIDNIVRDWKRIKIIVKSKSNLEDKGVWIWFICEEERVMNGVRYITRARIVDFSLVTKPLHDNYRFIRLKS